MAAEYKAPTELTGQTNQDEPINAARLILS
jgi:hypothetical protein